MLSVGCDNEPKPENPTPEEGIAFEALYFDGEDGVGYLLGSWYYTDDGITMAPFVSGTLNIEDGGSGKISVRFDVKDDRDNALYGRWIGYATEIE